MMNNSNVTTIRTVVVATLLGISALLCSKTTHALTFVLPPNGNVIGQIQHATVQPGDSLATIAMRYNVGGYEMVEANPGVNYERPRPGSTLIVPSRYVLPDAPRSGIVINIAEMRMYHYHPDGVHVSTYPVGVGQEGWNTPLGKTTITKKRPNPTWVVPDSIMANHLEKGLIIPKVKPPGPDNPLGEYAMNTGFTSIVIHGTPFPKAVGVRSSHGCIRMTNENVGELYNRVKVGTPVNIVHQPTKIGSVGDKIYMEAHVPISKELYLADFKDVNQLINKVTEKTGKKFSIEWREVNRLQHKANGIPFPIGAMF